MVGFGPTQRRIWRAFIANPDAELRTVDLGKWAYPRLSKLTRSEQWSIVRAARKVAEMALARGPCRAAQAAPILLVTALIDIFPPLIRGAYRLRGRAIAKFSSRMAQAKLLRCRNAERSNVMTPIPSALPPKPFAAVTFSNCVQIVKQSIIWRRAVSPAWCLSG